MEITVRAALCSDVAVLRMLEAEARAGLVGQRGGGRWLAAHAEVGERWVEVVDAARAHVATVDDAVVGFLVFTIEGTLGIVDAVYVTPQAREVGCGDSLLEMTMNVMKQRGATVIDAVALPGDRETKNLYERAGVKARLITLSAPLA